jgi:hypothetical protein
MCVTLPFKTIGCLLLLFSIPHPPAHAQQSPDSSSYDPATPLLGQYIYARLGADSRLYNGYEYIRNGTPAKGFPFFDSDSLLPGSLSYDGILYQDIPMEYDLVQDELVIPDYTGKTLISLISGKIDHFSIRTHHFRYLEAEKTASALPKTGFYEVLYASGPATLLARREKKLFFPSNRDDLARYDQENFYFLQLGDRFYRVDGKDDLLEALKDKKDALKKYIRDNKIRFSKQLEKALIQTTGYYLQISH